MKRWLKAVLAAVAVGAPIALVVALQARESLSASVRAEAAHPATAAGRSMILGAVRGGLIACFSDGVLARIELGDRDVDALTQWALARCGERVDHYIVKYLGLTQERAAEYARTQVRHEVELLARPVTTDLKER